MRKDGLLGLAATLLAIAALGCGRSETAPQPDTAVAPSPPIPGPPPPMLAADESWGSDRIDWQPYEAGLAKAKAQKKPVCLVFYTGWCPHCRSYSQVFEDARIAERARDFVMIRLNADEHQDLAEKYQPDGGYVPRTFFLAPDGTLTADVHAPRPKFLYFFDEHDPVSLLTAMGQALRKLGR